MRTYTKADLRIAEEAADWLLRLEQDTSPECHAEFVAWTKLSARNLHEFLFVKAASQELNGIDPGRTIDIATLGTDDGVVDLYATRSDATAPTRPISARSTWTYWISGIAAGLAGLVLAGLFLRSTADEPSTYSTGVGEQRSFKLGDGSLIHLNTESRVTVHFSSHGRDLRLVDGEALFVVARDTARPFRVDAGAAMVQAIGTQFNVYRRAGDTTVSVIEGRVRISDKTHKEEREAGAGEQAHIANNKGIEKRATPDVERALAWRERRLVFRADRLADVAEQFNRYNDVQIRVEGAAAREREMSGVFDADDPQPLLRFLGSDPQLSIEAHENEIVIRAR